MIGLATDIRLQQAPVPERSGIDNQAFYVNSFSVGGMQSSLGVAYTEDELITRLREIAASHAESAPAAS